MYCHDLYALSEEDFKTMGVKFGHRKRLVELLGDSDCLRQFLGRIGLAEREESLRALGFESVWSLLGVNASYTEKMGLSEDEMRRWLCEKEGLVIEKRADLMHRRHRRFRRCGTTKAARICCD